MHAAKQKPRGSGMLRRLSATQLLMLRGVAVFAASLLLVTTVRALAAHSNEPPAPMMYTGTARELHALRTSLDSAGGELEVMQLEVTRARDLLEYSSTYQIPADLAALIYDTALREGIDPNLAFRLVKIESDFKARALSPANAAGLAQVQVNTARFYRRDITLEQLFDPAANLTIGFRYLHELLGTYQGDLRLALLAYNRGPAKVNQLLGVGQEPGNGYASSVMRGYQPPPSGLP